jgi:hypothetical protein
MPSMSLGWTLSRFVQKGKKYSCPCAQFIKRRAMETYGRVERSWAPNWIEVSDQLHAPASSSLGKMLPVPIG